MDGPSVGALFGGFDGKEGREKSEAREGGFCDFASGGALLFKGHSTLPVASACKDQ